MTDDYEASEEIAISAGRKALQRAPWLFDRVVERTKGFFAELREVPFSDTMYSALCVDGNGTKLFLSPWSGNYRLAPIDATAMNANDMAPLLFAFPSEVMIYMACQTPVEEDHMGDIMNGFVDAFERIKILNAPWNMNIGKIETASLDEMISLGLPGKGVDFGVSMLGYINKWKVPELDPQPGHIIVGVSSTGMHSNGYTGGRHVILAPDAALEPRDEWRVEYSGKFRLEDTPALLEGESVLEAMQRPTALYLIEAADIGQYFDRREMYGVNITGNGLHNFNRVGKNVAFEITNPMDELPIHKLLMQESGWNIPTAYRKQNMGMGFAYIVPSIQVADGVASRINARGEHTAKIVGEVVAHDGELTTRLHKDGIHEFVGYNG